MKANRRVLACIADTHTFSRYALNPPSYLTEDNLLRFSIESKDLLYIYERYVDFCDTCRRLKADTVLLVGDLVHGQNIKERGTMLVSPDPNEQVKAVTKLLRPLTSGRKSYFWQGSGYHINISGYRVEEAICSNLGGRWMGMFAPMKFPPSNRLFWIEHGGGNSLIYPETKLGRSLNAHKVRQAILEETPVDCIMTAHHHEFIALHKSEAHSIQLPGWMAMEPAPIFQGQIIKAKKIGGVVVNIDSEDRIIPWHFTWNPPHIADKVQIG